jgi:putative hemolysin
MQTREMARSGKGFYSSCEFDLSAFGDEVLDDAIEIGRACIAKDHRNGRVLFLLFKGLAWYVMFNKKRHFFGCCSLTSQDPEEGLGMEEHLKENGFMHRDILVPLQSGYECELPAMTLRTFPEIKVPRLMKIYLNYGAKICSPPAIDRLFKTIDFMTLISLDDIDEKTLKMFTD